MCIFRAAEPNAYIKIKLCSETTKQPFQTKHMRCPVNGLLTDCKSTSRLYSFITMIKIKPVEMNFSEQLGLSSDAYGLLFGNFIRPCTEGLVLGRTATQQTADCILQRAPYIGHHMDHKACYSMMAESCLHQPLIRSM